MAHTPGPWRVELTNGWGICVRALKDKYIAWKLKSEADAHLIAAAPEMYEALKELDASWSREGWTPENAKARTVFTDDTIARWKNIRAALAKAEGK